jgi:selenide,water dikinase
MADAAGVRLDIQAAAVPLMANVMELARQGVVTRAHQSTLNHLGDRLDAGGVDEVLVKILADAQTSGGLLMAVPPELADHLVARLRHYDAPCAAVVGMVAARQDKSIQLLS